jgi:DNA-binding NarL/FixJ family response regulator
MRTKKIPLAIADDHTVFRQAIRQAIEQEGTFECVLEAADGKALIEGFRKADTKPSLLLLDLQMPELNGSEALQILLKEYPLLKTVVLSANYEEKFVSQLIKLGAKSFLPKECSMQELLQALQEVYRKGFYYNDFIVQAMAKDMGNQQKINSNALDKAALTKREIEILQLVCDGFSSVQIAEKLFLSEKTVNNHRNNIMQKVGAHNVSGMIKYAYLHNLIEIKP